MRPKQSISFAFSRLTEQERNDYRIQLIVSVLATRYCLNGELPFRGHDEKVTSLYMGNFLDLRKLIGKLNKNIGEVLKRTPKNCQLNSPHIQKEPVDCFKAEETSSSYLKAFIDSFVAVSLKQLKGQGYDGASNMRGEFNGLKAKILEENNSAYYVHCFAHQLQLVVVAVVRKHLGVVDFFDKLTLVMNVVCSSCKQKDILIDCEKREWKKKLVLEFVENEGSDGFRQNQASVILVYFESFDFVFYLHMMKYILGLTNILSQALQKDDQDILEAISMVKSTKEQLKRVNVTNRRFFEVECFNTVVDMQIQEFNDHFSEASTELLANMACLNPCDSFSQFNTSKLVRLSELYPNDFNSIERMELESQLNLYYANVTKDASFFDLNGTTDLATMMVKKRKHIAYPLVYRLLNLALIFPVATASVERRFSAMKIIKSDLRNRVGPEF
nr:hypothetical protein [Tanacetum cinerariifolium]